MIKTLTLLLLIVVLAAVGAFSQNPPNTPGQATATLNGAPAGCAPYTVACVSTVNGRSVCPYGRVAAFPIPAKGNWPGQPYTVFTYPKTDQQGNPINLLGLPNGPNPTTLGCVYTLPPWNPGDSTTWVEGGHF